MPWHCVMSRGSHVSRSEQVSFRMSSLWGERGGVAVVGTVTPHPTPLHFWNACQLHLSFMEQEERKGRKDGRKRGDSGGGKERKEGRKK